MAMPIRHGAFLVFFIDCPMRCDFYSCNDYKNALQKTLTNAHTLNVKLLDSADVARLSLRLKKFPLGNYNYCYIEKLQRYYFIDGVTVYSDYVVLDLTEDVLMTYRELILNATGIVTESAAGGNGYDASNKFEVLTYPLTNPFDGKSDVLVTVQGA